MDNTLKDIIIDSLPDFDTGNSSSAKDIYDYLQLDYPTITKEEVEYLLEEMVNNNEIRRAPQKFPYESDRFCKLPPGGVVKLPPSSI